MGYRRWRPGSRRDRRRSRRQPGAEGADKTFAIIVGLFALAVILLLAALWFFSG